MDFSTSLTLRTTLKFLLLLVLAPPLQAGFIHPGLLHSQSDLDRMRLAVARQQQPIYAGFEVLVDSPHSKSDYRRKGPFPEFGRAPNIHTAETQSDAKAAYENALMWAVTGDRTHAEKSIEITNAWVGSLERVTGIDGVLAAGLQGFKFANAAEILRHTDSGWPEHDAQRCADWLKNAWLPTIEHYAYFANGNWETAALQTKMAIAVYCDDRILFEEVVRYAVDGAGNGSIPHMVVYPTGQSQETTRAQHYAQLGLGLLGATAEIAWNQGVDLYGWDDNRILKGFEYAARYGLGEEVPYQHYLDRTGKYGFGGRNNHYQQISTKGRGRFLPIFERTLHHYSARRGIDTPYTTRAAALRRPESHSRDHVGLGTLTHWRNPNTTTQANLKPGSPAGLVARATSDGIDLTWVRTVDPTTATDAQSYSLMRSTAPGGPYTTVAENITLPEFHDTGVTPGSLYYYIASATNTAGTSAPSVELTACAGLPSPWTTADIGAVTVPGHTTFDTHTFTLEGEGHDIGDTSDGFHFAYAPMQGEGTITARIIRPMSSQWTKPGVMMRESLDADSPHASVLLLPHWSGALVTRSEKAGATTSSNPKHLGGDHIIKNNRLSTPYWVRLVRFRNRFTGYMSADGYHWDELGSAEIPMGRHFFVGLPACSQLDGVTTTVTYDRVSIPTWRMPDGENQIASRPQPRWHQDKWLERHQRFNQRVKQGNVDLLMIGDSITHWWETDGKPVWDHYYGHRNAVNLAISGDRTEHVLWR
ncbi:MAG: alginate lyase family protein, partial [Verrucomicrobiales bacterium]|nr:alginate lyase family protein [Verrucomicrobiales bacterium]